MLRQIAHPMHMIPRKERGQGRECIKRDIARFAGITHSNFTAETNSRFLIQISEFTDYSSLRELRKYKKEIQRGGKEEDYPLAGILKKEGRHATEIAAFLGTEYFERFVRILAGPNNIKDRKLSETALKWAVEYGDEKLGAYALAGIVKGAAQEVENCGETFCSRSFVERSGLMGFLTKQLGSQSAWKLTDRINDLKEVRTSLVLGASFLVGAAMGALTYLPSKESAAQAGALAIVVGGAVVGGAAIAKLVGASTWGLRRSIMRIIQKGSQDEHV